MLFFHIELGLFEQLLIILSLSVVVISLCHKLKIPETLAYLFVGLVLSPSVLNVVSNDHNIELLAEIGVVFLLFSLGLEFSLSQIKSMSRLVFGLGGLQVLIGTCLIASIGVFLKLPAAATLVIAASLSLSSTAIVSKELARRNETRTNFGKAVIGTLVFQDIAAVTFIIIITTLAANNNHTIGMSLFFSLIKGALFILTMIFLGKKILPHLFHEVAAIRSEELFVLTAIVIALLAAMFSSLLGLSMALGGFVAGTMLGESHYRHQIETDIRPFRDILLGLFFVSVGLMIRLDHFFENWIVIILGALSLIIFKAILINFLGQMIGLDKKSSFKAGLALAQGGEFCFALIALAGQHHLLEESLSVMVLSITILSMAATPFLLRYSNVLYDLLQGRKPKKIENNPDILPVEEATSDLDHHVLICGYGRVGQIISRFLAEDGMPYVVLDDDPLHVREGNNAGEPVFFGDCARKDILKACAVKRAKMVVICLSDAITANKVLCLIRELHKTLPVLVRTQDDSMMETLYENGATHIIPEILESSLLIVDQMFTMLGKSREMINQRIQLVRQKKYRRLHGMFIGKTERLYNAEGLPANVRHTFTLDSDSIWINKSLSDINLESIGIEIDKIIRNDRQLDPEEASTLKEHDSLLMTGSAPAIAQALEKLNTRKKNDK
ncbi:MAG: sodium:proton antiporter [Endozoicomonadaceae bacterium]|nr:sodium:proton antiporter [Endozoicomonadaceae bacterium]